MKNAPSLPSRIASSRSRIPSRVFPCPGRAPSKSISPSESRDSISSLLHHVAARAESRLHPAKPSSRAMRSNAVCRGIFYPEPIAWLDASVDRLERKASSRNLHFEQEMQSLLMRRSNRWFDDLNTPYERYFPDRREEARAKPVLTIAQCAESRKGPNRQA